MVGERIYELGCALDPRLTKTQFNHCRSIVWNNQIKKAKGIEKLLRRRQCPNHVTSKIFRIQETDHQLPHSLLRVPVQEMCRMTLRAVLPLLV